ncbi:MAG: carbonic anhydrase [Candidatus Dormibacteraeota bacterium]|uniref:carbonic anhydrase n=1 Tax=Candidatus Dormiibacter inghamiae TaxID=3127013 RepID=A0A934KG03_9BACT|nr:carbonic anhydrase [Candidatus Dormibacteraeota bacterium]MBJ7607040.1 carbonic anhydrase [Candidatus Dormibacteraeota bacterium]
MDPLLDVLIANNEYVKGSHVSGLAPEPTRQLIVLTCMDARLDLFAALGLHLGEAHIIRNAGGIMTDDVVRSMLLSSWALGTRDLLVLQHTQCGLHGLNESALKDRIEAGSGVRPAVQLGSFDDIERRVRESVWRARAEPGLRLRRVLGGVFDVATGAIRQV